MGLEHIQRMLGYRTDSRGRPIGFEPYPDFDKCDIVLWRVVQTDPASGQTRMIGGKLLILDHVKQRVLFISANDTLIATRPDGTRNFELIDLTDRFQTFTPLYRKVDGSQYSDREVPRLLFNQMLVLYYAEVFAWGFRGTTAPQPIAGGYAFEFEGDEGSPAPGRHAAFVWEEEQESPDKYRRAWLFGPSFPPEKRDEALYRRLKALKDEARPWVVGQAPGQSDELACVYWERQTGRYALYLNPNAPGLPLPTEVPLGDQLALAHEIAQLAWRVGIPPRELRSAWTGPRGWAVRVNQGLWLVPKLEVIQKRQTGTGCFFLSWADLENWNSPTSVHLPKEWSSAKERARWKDQPERIVGPALSDWEAERSGSEGEEKKHAADRWGADPLGLLLGLGEEWGGADAK